jgi:shikimate kinase
LIYLIGYSYSGKSTLGRQLASLLKYNLFDTDSAIEHKYHTSVPLIFNRYGEKAFRIIERQILFSTAELQNTVVATGGGTACCDENIRFMLEHGTVIHLSMSVDDIEQRIAISHKVRPLLQGMETDERRNFLEAHLAQRLPFYQQAHITIPALTATAEQLAKAVLFLQGDHRLP